MAETPKTNTPEPKADKAVEPVAEKLVPVVLTTTFITNDRVYGGPEGEDEDGVELVYEELVPQDVADDLKRRQREYDRSMKARFIPQSFRVNPNGRMAKVDTISPLD